MEETASHTPVLLDEVLAATPRLFYKLSRLMVRYWLWMLTLLP
jgi:hypothetical protein